MTLLYNKNMIKSFDLENTYKHIKNVSTEQKILLYVDITNIIKLLKTTSVIYKTVPSLKTKIIMNTKIINENTEDSSDAIFNLLNKINLINLKRDDENKIKVFITTNDGKIIEKISGLFNQINDNSNILNMLDEDNFYLSIKENKLNKLNNYEIVTVGLQNRFN